MCIEVLKEELVWVIDKWFWFISDVMFQLHSYIATTEELAKFKQYYTYMFLHAYVVLIN